MRKFKTRFGIEIDLDNPKTYSYLKTDDLNKLDDMMFKEIGQALVYMDYFKDRLILFPKKKTKKEKKWRYAGYNQRQRVYRLIRNFANNRHLNYKNKMWYKEQIFLFQNETENMC